MSYQESDISWDVLRRIVRDWAGNAAELNEVIPLVGGCVNTTLSLKTRDGAKAVLKISPHRVNHDLIRESRQLELLRRVGLPVPQVYTAQLASLDYPDSYLLMEFVEGVDLHTARERCSADQYDGLQRHLACLVLMMHQHKAEEYFRAELDDAPRFAAWPGFFRHVYEQIWHDVEKSNELPVKVRKQIHKIHDRLDTLIAHDDCPRLVHWDIWATNILARPDAQGQWKVAAVLDPNCKYAHVEAEIAYMELFHTITPAFMKEYQSQHRLNGSYHNVRRWVYQLYPLVDHVHLFGREYLKPLMSTLDKLAHVLP